jgi:hypothetical protein
MDGNLRVVFDIPYGDRDAVVDLKELFGYTLEVSLTRKSRK